MNLRPTRANENQRRHPRAGGGPCQEELDSRLRGNDMRAVILRRASGRKPEGGAWLLAVSTPQLLDCKIEGTKRECL